MNNPAHKHGALNCETCGGALNYSAEGLSAVCPYCGSSYVFSAEKSEALALALNRANAMRMSCDFDGAIREYSLITSRNPQDAEAHWGLALSRYGIEYIDDSRMGRRVPTCRRTVACSILQDSDFLAAVKYSDAEQAEVYKSRAAVIDRLQRDIKRKMEEEEGFDVFLCFRSADENGAPTRERTVARKIYDELTSRKIKTFFSEVTLKDRVGEDYEPIIFKALYSCKFFVLIACSEENINSPWVKNEWSRFRDRAEQERLYGACCAVYDVPVTALPPFIRSLQGVNLAKYPAGGYEIELADNLHTRFFGGKRLPSSGVFDQKRPASPEGKIQSPDSLLIRAEQDLGDKMYKSAYAKYQHALEIDPYSGQAWWGCFLASRRAYSGGIAAQNMTYEAALTIEEDRNLKNAERYGDAEVRSKVDAFRKMCAFRCNELAAQCREEIDSISARADRFREQKDRAEFRKTNLRKQLDRCKCKISAISKPIFKYTLIAGVIFFIMMGILAAVTDEEEFCVFGAVVMVFCILGGVIARQGMAAKLQKAREEEASISAEIAAVYAEIESLSGKIAVCKEEAAELRRKEEIFLRVFFDCRAYG